MTTVTEGPPRHPLVVELLAEAERRIYTDGELARALDIHHRTIQNWKRGVTPRARHQRAIRRWLNEDDDAAA